MNQIKVIQEAERAFIVKINQATRESLSHRYQVYVERKGSVFPLFGEKKIKYQIQFPKGRQMPHFHFVLKGKDNSNVQKIGTALREINPKLPIHYLNGY